eukprot:gb/GECH01013273.1/.p1 GENE.gb/GECH01013273.1/~~gb/GECH01013273.1/.p1  ORF type:complete len:588 (+),score=110.07 gb/GECH01013273.1/:1-1764(+)
MGEENSNKVESFLSCSYRNQRASIRLNQLLNILNNMYSGEPLRAQHSNHYGRFRGRTKDVGSPLLNYSSTNTSPSSPSPSPNLSSSSPHIRRRSRSITRTRTPISNSFTTATDQYSSYHIRSSSREKQRYSNRSHNDKNDIEMIRSNSDLSLGNTNIRSSYRYNGSKSKTNFRTTQNDSLFSRSNLIRDNYVEPSKRQFRAYYSNEDLSNINTSSKIRTNKDKYSNLNQSNINKNPNNLTGIDNLGNTCFMNSVFQCLFHLNELRNYFLSGEYSNHINSNSEFKGVVAKEFAAVSKRLCNDPGTSISISSFKRVIDKVSPQFIGFQQHDSQELLRFLLDGLHEDLNQIKGKRPYQEMEDIEGEHVINTSDRWWNYHLSRNKSFISNIFSGQLKNSVTCLSCGHESLSFDPFMDLSLPIPQSNDFRSTFSAFSKSGIKITDCLDLFLKEEVLKGREQAYCSKCKKHRDSKKKFTIFRYPRVLVLHLKRFSYNNYFGDKVKTKVEFPETLDMIQYWDPEAKKYYQKNYLPHYKLHGVVNHGGSLSCGHYTATCRVQDKGWFEFDDSYIHQTNQPKGGASPYILFYTLND